MAYFHGINTSERKSSLATPVTAKTGITFAVGTAPVHTVNNGKINKLVCASSYAEAVAALGYSDDWDKFSLCEVMKTFFGLYQTSPVIFVNVLDPATHKAAVAATSFTLVGGKAELPITAIATSVEVKSAASGGTTYEKDTDYVLLYSGEKLVVETVSGGAIVGNTVYISYDAIDASAVTASDVIGGIDTTTGVKTGLELVNSAFTTFGIVPELLIAPKYSENTTVAAAMNAKADNISNLFKGKAIIDVPTSSVTKYSDVETWKTTNNVNGVNEICCYPNVSLDSKKYHLSTHIAALIATIDIENGDVPANSPSNKPLKIDSTVLSDGSEIVLELSEANTLNSKGVATALNFMGKFVLWGNETACFPTNTDVKDYFICVNRMFAYIAQSVILTYWSKVDGKMTRRLVDSIVDSINIWLNGLVADEQLLGGRIEYREEDNMLTGNTAVEKAKFRIFITPHSPARELEFMLEYDADYVGNAMV